MNIQTTKPINFLITLILLIGPNLAVAQEAKVVKDVVYGHKDGMAMIYDVAKPSTPNGAGIIYVVSGGFVSGEDNLKITQPFWSTLLDHGYTLFQIYHPGMPKYRIPDAVEALQLGISHIKESSETFGVDPTRLGILGISSGGHLALQLALSREPTNNKRDDIKAVVAFMPITDLSKIDPESSVFGVKHLDFDLELIPKLSPSNFVTNDDPPTLLIQGSHDQVVNPESNSYTLANLLNEAGVENRLLTLDAGHEIFPASVMEIAHRAMVQWFDDHLHP